MTELEVKAYYSPEETAEYLGVEASTIRELCRRGEIPGARRVGRLWRIPRNYLVPEEKPDKNTHREK